MFIGKKNPHEKVQPEAGGVHRPTSDPYKTAGGGETGEHSGRAGSSGSKVSGSVNLRKPMTRFCYDSFIRFKCYIILFGEYGKPM